MVVFTKEGVEKLKMVALGALTLTIVGDMSEYGDEISILLTKMSYLLASNQSNKFTYSNGQYILGVPSGNTINIDASKLFEYFGVDHIMETIPDSAIISRNSGFCYSTALGEPLLLNPILGIYACNDGSKLDQSLFRSGKMIPLRKELMASCMPLLYAEHKAAEKSHTAKLKALNLVGLKEGSSVRIRQYADLVTQFGEQMIVINTEDDTPILVEVSDDPDAVRFIKALGYAKMSADYYNGKEGIIESIDIPTGNLVINIDGATKHTKFIDEGVTQSSSDEEILFSLEHIELTKA